MFELLTFIYSNAALTAALTIGGWVGAAIGAVFGSVLVCKYMLWDYPRDSAPLSLLARFASYTGYSALFLTVAAICAIFGFTMGACVLFAAWSVLLPALVGGTISLFVHFVRQRMKSVKLTHVDSGVTVADRT